MVYYSNANITCSTHNKKSNKKKPKKPKKHLDVNFKRKIYTHLKLNENFKLCICYLI